jgi:hypothetical protein
MRCQLFPLAKMMAALSVVVLCGQARGMDVKIGAGEPIQAGQSFRSPAGTYLATFTGEGFKIEALATRRVAKVQSIPPVFRAAWTGDEKTLATIEHLAGGTDAVCFHFDEAQETWKRIEVDPPGGPFEHYQVMSWDVGETRMRITYKAFSRNGSTFVTYSVAFDFDPRRNGVGNVTITKLTEDTVP